MKINIVVPPNIGYLKILLKSKKYFKYNGMLNHILKDINNQYSIFINKYYISIYINVITKKVLNSIKLYIEYIFKDKYIGIYEDQKEFFHIINVKGIDIYYLNTHKKILPITNYCSHIESHI